MKVLLLIAISLIVCPVAKAGMDGCVRGMILFSPDMFHGGGGRRRASTQPTALAKVYAQAKFYPSLEEFPHSFPDAWSIISPRITTSVGRVVHSPTGNREELAVGLSAAQMSNLDVHQRDNIVIELVDGRQFKVTIYNADGESPPDESAQIVISEALAEKIGKRDLDALFIVHNRDLENRIKNPDPVAINDWDTPELTQTTFFPSENIWEKGFTKVKARVDAIAVEASALGTKGVPKLASENDALEKELGIGKSKSSDLEALRLGLESSQRLNEPFIGLSTSQMTNLGVSRGDKLLVRFKKRQVQVRVYNAAGPESSRSSDYVALSLSAANILGVQRFNTLIIEKP
jgi:hypothetical protein